MKKITYKFISNIFDNKEIVLEKTIELPNEEFENALPFIVKEAYNGEYTVEDDGTEEVNTPSQLDIIEAQVTYTAMMTNTLLEV